MFVRRSMTRSGSSGESYFTYRLVQSQRIAGKVRQVTRLNLGRHFMVDAQHWPALCARLEQLIGEQAALVAVELPEAIELLAMRYAAQLMARAPVRAAPASAKPEYVEIDADSLELVRPRSVGVEHAGLYAMQGMGFVDKLEALGINAEMRAAIIGSVIARMAMPGSELGSWKWLSGASALGELLGVDFEAMGLMRLYRASDVLMKHREAIEAHLFEQVRTLFALEATVTLYDLTNTYFEGQSAANAKARRGRSKEKRRDCALLTLGLVLDGSGFVRRSQVFAGNAVECHTLQGMLEGLGAPAGALVIMDRGIATEANLAWLVERGYRYLVVSRAGARQFDAAGAMHIDSASGHRIGVCKTLSDDGKEVRLYCHSPGREHKERAMSGRFVERFEAGLTKLAQGLSTPRGEKCQARILERIGRLKANCRGIAQHYQIELHSDDSGKRVRAITWRQTPLPGTMLTDPGVYCLRSNEIGWDVEKLWRTYMMLTDLEAVFRTLKSELGLRPIFHSKPVRSDGHLFISVLAYQFVQLLRTRLKAHGIKDSWSSLRNILSVQRRVTACFTQRNGRTLNVRKSTRAEPALAALYAALGIDSAPGGTRKHLA